MSGKSGKRATGKKPVSVRRQNAKTTGAFGKEGREEIETGAVTRNVDKAVRRGGAGG